jgi:DNA-binding GntR family transcriptional regulator
VPEANRAHRSGETAQLPTPPAVELDRRSRLPLYHQIADELRRRIEEGGLEAGTLLGNEIQLAQRLVVSRPTIRKAIAELVEQGLVVRRRGLGTVVLPNSVKRRFAEASLFDHLLKTDRSPSTRVLEMTARNTPEAVRSVFGVSAETEITKVGRLRYANGAPLALMTNWILVKSIDKDDLEQQGLYELLRQAAVVPAVVDQTIGARRAATREARLLEIKPRDPVLTVDVVAYDSAGKAVDVGQHVYRADRYSFEITHVDS